MFADLHAVGAVKTKGDREAADGTGSLYRSRRNSLHGGGGGDDDGKDGKQPAGVHSLRSMKGMRSMRSVRGGYAHSSGRLDCQLDF